VESLHNLEENLQELGLSIESIPLVMQFNKRDLGQIVSVEELNAKLNPDGRFDYFESVAVDGTGVFETLKAITKLTLRTLRRRMAAQEGVAAPAAPPPAGGAPRPQVAFNPSALTAAAAEGLGTPSSAVVPPTQRAPAILEKTLPGTSAAPAAARPVPQAAPALATAAPAPAPAPATDHANDTTAKVPAALEVEEAPVEFATTPEPVTEAVETEMRHVKVSSSLDILSELETLRKSSTFRAEPKPARNGTPSLDIDTLLQSSVNSRQEVKRRVDERVGKALGRASRCLVSIQLVDEGGHPVRDALPVEVELKRGERLRHLALTLFVNLQGE